MLVSSPSASSSLAAYIAANSGPNARKTMLCNKGFGKVVQQLVNLLTGDNVHLLPLNSLRETSAVACIACNGR